LERLRPREAATLTAHAGGWFESTPERLRELAAWFEATPSFGLTYGDGVEAAAVVRRLLPARPNPDPVGATTHAEASPS
jgi:hypothetical protein